MCQAGWISMDTCVEGGPGGNLPHLTLGWLSKTTGNTNSTSHRGLPTIHGGLVMEAITLRSCEFWPLTHERVSATPGESGLWKTRKALCSEPQWSAKFIGGKYLSLMCRMRSPSFHTESLIFLSRVRITNKIFKRQVAGREREKERVTPRVEVRVRGDLARILSKEFFSRGDSGGYVSAKQGESVCTWDSETRGQFESPSHCVLEILSPLIL